MAGKVTLTRVVGVKATTVGMLQGTFFSLIGLVTAISYSISAGVEFADSTESLLRGLTFGLTHGLIAIIFVPIIYFIAGWILGALYGVILNAVLGGSGGVVLKIAPVAKSEEK
jgi:hypothetical protein